MQCMHDIMQSTLGDFLSDCSTNNRVENQGYSLGLYIRPVNEVG